MTVAALVPVTAPFVTLKEVLARWDAAKTALEEAKQTEEALGLEAYNLAVSIRKQGLEDPNFELAPTFMEGKTIEKVDSELLREKHPDLYRKSNPHIDNNGIAAVLKSVHTDAEIQQMTKDINEELWYQKSRVTKSDLKKAVGKNEWQKLEEEGIIVSTTTWSGEIKLVNKKFQEELDRQHERFLPHEDAELMEDDE